MVPNFNGPLGWTNTLNSLEPLSHMSFRVNVSKFSTSLANHICFRPQHNIAGWTLHRDVGRSAADDRPLDPAVGRVLYMVVEVSCLQHMGQDVTSAVGLQYSR